MISFDTLANKYLTQTCQDMKTEVLKGLFMKIKCFTIDKSNQTIIEEYEKEWRELYEDSLTRAFNRRQLLEGEWKNLDKIIKQCWIAFREYYAEP